MILISHRGNVSGSCKEIENNPAYIKKLLKIPFLHIEIDLWVVDGKLFLGHDAPQYEIDDSFLRSEKFYIHCKNAAALHYCSKEHYHYFYHDKDDFTITSRGDIWAFPGQSPGNGIFLSFEEEWNLPGPVKGICADWITEENIARIKNIYPKEREKLLTISKSVAIL